MDHYLQIAQFDVLTSFTGNLGNESSQAGLYFINAAVTGTTNFGANGGLPDMILYQSGRTDLPSVGGSGFFIRNNLRVGGTLSKAAGTFQIDHPLERLKETHTLVHSFIEGPKADNIYRGKTTLINGMTSINIDNVSNMTEGTFESLNKDIQCFTSNETGWDPVKGKVVGNILTIESINTESSDTISWMVIGERKDDYYTNSTMTDENGKLIVERPKI
jgi:hypothetical protein